MTRRVSVRPARVDDLDAIVEIYNHYVLHSPTTFDVDPVTVEERRRWFEHYSPEGPYRLLVAQKDGLPVGYATSSLHRPKPAYRTSVETSIYLSPTVVGEGLGSLLYGELFRCLEGEALHRAYAGITLPNPASLALHHRFGFRSVGIFQEVGFKHGRYWSVQWMEKDLDPGLG